MTMVTMWTVLRVRCMKLLQMHMRQQPKLSTAQTATAETAKLVRPGALRGNPIDVQMHLDCQWFNTMS